MSDIPRYWQGTVLCHRKALSHINRNHCLQIHDEEKCGSCECKKNILWEQHDEEEEEKKLKAERKALSPSKRKTGDEK